MHWQGAGDRPVRGLGFGVLGVWRLAFGVERFAVGGRRLAVGGWRSCESETSGEAATHVRLKVRTNSGVEVPIGQQHWPVRSRR